MALNQVAKEELALALLLWKDFKIQGNPEPIKVYQNANYLATELGIKKEYDAIIQKAKWPFKITMMR